MNIKISNKSGIVLKVAGKYIDEDITLIPDESLFASGYTVTINNDFPYSQYSLDDGQTWIDLDNGETVLTEVKTIKFNWNGMAMAPDGNFLASIGTTANGTDIINNWASGPSDNITISQDTTFYIWHSGTTSGPIGI